jgi:flagellar hook protein FlgE
MPMTVYDSLGNKHTLTMTLTNLSGTQIPGAAAGIVYDNNTWSWRVDTDLNDTSVHLALDNTTYTDPVTNEVVRASSSGLIHFNTNGSLDYVVYQDMNGQHFGTGTAGSPAFNDVNIPGGTTAPAANGWLPLANADTWDDSVIGFEGATVPQNSAYNPAGVPPVLWGNNRALDLEKLPIVLVYQGVDNTAATIPTTPVPPSGTSAGTAVQIDVASADAILGTAAALQNWYVQSIDIDWGTVSTITGGQFDIAGAAGDLPNSHDNVGSPNTILRSAFGQRDGLTQDTAGTWTTVAGLQVYKPAYTCAMTNQDGYSELTLSSVSVDSNGIVRGQFVNAEGQTKYQDLAQLAIANFANAGGLAKVGSSSFTPTANSGSAVISTANSGGRGSVVGGALEQSNVDLSKELTDMIIAQRGFEVNARLVTTSDTILNTLVNLGR